MHRKYLRVIRHQLPRVAKKLDKLEGTRLGENKERRLKRIKRELQRL